MEGLVTKAGDILLSHGLLGIVILAEAWFIWDLGRKLQSANDRLHEAKAQCYAEVRKAWDEMFGYYKSTHESLGLLSGSVDDVVEVTKERTDAVKATAKAQEMSAGEIARLTAEAIRGREEVAAQRAEITALRSELARLREALVTKGLRPDG
jgi:chromosome segregation ATPase